MLLPGLLLAASAATGALLDPGFDLTTWTTEDGLPSDAVIALAQTTDGYLWIGTNARLHLWDGGHSITLCGVVNPPRERQPPEARNAGQ